MNVYSDKYKLLVYTIDTFILYCCDISEPGGRKLFLLHSWHCDMIRTKHPRGTGAWLVFVRCQETRDNGDSRQVSNPVRIRCGLA